MAETIKARFVGGHKHNEVIECQRLPIIHTVAPRPILSFEDLGKLMHDTIETEDYRLFRFVSDGGAKYVQYVHESLIKDGEPDASTYRERTDWPKLPSEMTYYFEMKILRAVIHSHR